MLALHTRMNNPLALAAAETMLVRAYANTMSTDTVHGTLTDSTTTCTMKTPTKCAESKKWRNRWAVAVTLGNNPSLSALRSNSVVPDNTRDLRVPHFSEFLDSVTIP